MNFSTKFSFFWIRTSQNTTPKLKKTPMYRMISVNLKGYPNFVVFSSPKKATAGRIKKQIINKYSN